VGLLTGVLSLAREPVRLTLRAWELGFSAAASAARLGVELLDPDRPATAAERYPPPPPASRGNGGAPDVEGAAPAGPETAATAPAAADAPEGAATAPAAPDADSPPAIPDELIPDHVDEEVVLVAEVAEEGAEEGAGAELHIDEPWEGYDKMTAPQINDRLAVATAELAATVELYESAGKARRTVLEAAERALRA
jgi:hypothetical protein